VDLKNKYNVEQKTRGLMVEAALETETGAKLPEDEQFSLSDKRRCPEL